MRAPECWCEAAESSASGRAPTGIVRAGRPHGGTLVPGFIDSHAHPVFAGNQIRHCDLREAETARGMSSWSPPTPRRTRTRRGSPAAAGRWTRFPAASRPGEMLDAVVPDRPVFLPNRDGHGAWVNSRALELAGVDAATPDPADGRIEREAGRPPGRNAAGRRLGAGRATAPGRHRPRTGTVAAHRAAIPARPRHHRLAGRDPRRLPGRRRPAAGLLRAAGDGSLVATVVGALWWDRNRGLEQVAGADRATRPVAKRPVPRDQRQDDARRRRGEPHGLHARALPRRRTGARRPHAGWTSSTRRSCRATSRRWTREGFQVHFHALGDRAVRNALDAIAAARQAQRVERAPAPPRAPAGRASRRHPALRGARGHRQHAGAVGDPRAADGRAHHPVPRRAPVRLAVPVPLAAGRRCGDVRWQRLAGEQPRPAARHPRRGQPQPAGLGRRRRQRRVPPRAVPRPGLDARGLHRWQRRGERRRATTPARSAPAWTPTSR